MHETEAMEGCGRTRCTRGVAVIGSLIAVAAELRQTQTSLQSQAYQARAFDGIAGNFEIVVSEQLRTVMKKIEADDFDPSTLSETEYDIAKYILTTVRIDIDNEYYQFQNGFLDPGFYYGETAERIKEEAPKWRSMGLGEPRPDFHAEVERLLAEE